ncbi:MAG: type IIL restriction-modification enzyme MmeI [Kiritimatiellia bacterium]
MRAALLAAAHFRWERISPAVFGSLFQGVSGTPANAPPDRRPLHLRIQHPRQARPLLFDDPRRVRRHSRGLAYLGKLRLTGVAEALAALR